MKIQIDIDESHLNLPRRFITAGALASLRAEIVGVPEDITTLMVYVGRPPDKSTTPPTPREDVAVAARSVGHGRWSVYFSPFCFPEAARGLYYNVSGVDAEVNPRWLGSGELVVEANPAHGSPVVPPVIPPDTYVRNPVTGLYHKLVAEVDDLGNITIAVDQEGVEQ